MEITEPMTMLTDYLLATLVLIWYGRIRDFRNSPAKYWKYSFLAVGIAAITGGTYHGFTNFFSGFTLLVMWAITLHLVAVANLALMLGGIHFSLQDNDVFRRSCYFLAVVKFAIIEALIAISPVFVIVGYDYSLSFLFVIGLRLRDWLKSDQESIDRNYLLVALLFGISVGVVWMLEISLSSWFNHNDIAHLLQIGVIFSIYAFIVRNNSYEQ